MKSVKLTNAMRENILRSVLNKVMEPKSESLRLRSEEALATYLSSQLPEGFPQNSDFAYRPSSVDVNVYTQDSGYNRVGYTRVDNVKDLPVRCKGKGYSSFGYDIEIDSSTEWGKAFLALYNEKETIKDETRELEQELNKLLYGCTTTKQLAETYPDIEKYVVLDEEKALPVPQDFSKLTSLLRG